MGSHRKLHHLLANFLYICDQILENQSKCHIEMHRITQFFVTTAKGLQNVSKHFLVIQGGNYTL